MNITVGTMNAPQGRPMSDLDIARHLYEFELVRENENGVRFQSLPGLAWPILLEVYIAARDGCDMGIAALRATIGKSGGDVIDGLTMLKTKGYVFAADGRLRLTPAGEASVEKRVRGIMGLSAGN